MKAESVSVCNAELQNKLSKYWILEPIVTLDNLCEGLRLHLPYTFVPRCVFGDLEDSQPKDLHV